MTFSQSGQIELSNDLTDTLNAIDAIKELKLKYICIYAYMDCFAQAYNKTFSLGLNRNSQKFINFIEEFGIEQYAFLNAYDPVTLFYHYESELTGKFSLNFVPKSIGEIPIENLLDNEASKKIIESCNDKPHKEKHKISNLIYKARSKFMHEFRFPGGTWGFEPIEHKETPFYYSIIDFTCKNPNEEENYVELIFPYKFLRNLADLSINNYFDFCIKKNIDPFNNPKKYRHWYE